MGPLKTRSNKGGNWSCREATPADQDFLWEMLYVALWDPPRIPPRPRSVLQHPRVRLYVEGWGREGDCGLVAIDPESGEKAGAIWTRLVPPATNPDYGCPYPEIGMAVRPECHGRGAGTALLEALIESLRTRVEGLRLGVHPENEVAMRLYEKFGFAQYAIGAGDYPQMKLGF